MVEKIKYYLPFVGVTSFICGVIFIFVTIWFPSYLTLKLLLSCFAVFLLCVLLDEE